MAETTGLSRARLVNELVKIGHGNYTVYKEVGMTAVTQESELFAHLIAWNNKHGEVRDSKIALPIIALRGQRDDELFENAVANLCTLDPGNLLKAYYFDRDIAHGRIEIVEKQDRILKGKKVVVKSKREVKFNALPVSSGGTKMLRTGVELYLRARERNKKWWDKTAVQHRDALKSLYTLFHVKPNTYADAVLFKKQYPANSVFYNITQLKHMSAQEAAGTILNYDIPFLIAVGALGGVKNKPDIVLALIERMSGNELINNTAMLEKCGVFENATLKAAYAAAVERMKKQSKPVSTLKAGKAAEAIKKVAGEGSKAAKQLEKIQEDRLAKLGGIEGDWLVLGDRSGSMHTAIEVARQVASLITQQVKGKVYLVFFNNSPMLFDVSGKSLPEIQEMTKRLNASGGTSIGCGLDMIAEKGVAVQGIAICSDGGDNAHPYFHNAYQKYVQKFAIEPTVYHFSVPGDPNVLKDYCYRRGISVQEANLGANVDYNSLPNLVKMMRTSKYSLLQEIMEFPLLTFADVFKG
jgi:hypothetical protein